MSSSTIRLVTWLAWASWLRSWRRVVFASTIATAVVVLLLVGASVRSVAESVRARTEAVLPATWAPPGSAGPGVLQRSVKDRYRGQSISVTQVAVIGSSDLPPPGVTRLPGPGELLVSPALAQLMDDPLTTLATRYPGRVVGSIGPDGLSGPRSLVAYVGVNPSELSSDAILVTEYGQSAEALALPYTLVTGTRLMVIAFLIPLLALFAMACSMGSAEREQRLAALRLLGMASGHAKMEVAVEAGFSAILGLLAGIASFALLRAAVSARVPIGAGLFPEDVVPSIWFVIAMVVGLPTLAITASWLAIRRVETGPLGVVRRSSVRVARGWRLWPLLVGVACLGLSGLVRGDGDAGVAASGTLLLIAVVLIMLGLALGSSVVNQWISRRVSARANRVGLALAAHRVIADPAATARPAAGLAFGVYLAGMLLTFFPLLADSATLGYREFEQALLGETVMSQVGSASPASLDALRHHEGVQAVAEFRQIRVSSADAPLKVVGAVAVDCRDLTVVAPVPMSDCARGLVSSGRDPFLAVARSGGSLVVNGSPDVTAPGLADPVVSSIVSILARGMDGYEAPLLPLEGSLPAAAGDPQRDRFDHEGIILVRIADGADIEAVRTAVIRTTGASNVITAAERAAEAGNVTSVYREMTTAILALVGLVAAASLLVTTTEQVRAQRRSLVMLRICGTPIGTLQGSLLQQMLLTTVPATIAAFVLGTYSATVFAALNESSRPSVPVLAITLVWFGALVVPVLAAVGTMPTLRASVRHVMVEA